jgi:hypothetical protein
MPITIPTTQQARELRHLRESMRRANVPEDAINQVVEDQTQYLTFHGWVTTIGYGLYADQRIEVQFGGETSLLLHFPPNDTKYLPEIIRAQSHPHLYVAMNLKTEEGRQIIESLVIGLDYEYPWPDNKPPFDNVTLNDVTLSTPPQATTFSAPARPPGPPGPRPRPPISRPM